MTLRAIHFSLMLWYAFALLIFIRYAEDSGYHFGWYLWIGLPYGVMALLARCRIFKEIPWLTFGVFGALGLYASYIYCGISIVWQSSLNFVNWLAIPVLQLESSFSLFAVVAMVKFIQNRKCNRL